MGIIDIILIGVGLSMDAFAVTISNSLSMPRLTWRQKIWLPIAFGAFQMLMPLTGYFAGSFFASLIESIAGLFALIVLGVLGVNMMREGIMALRHPDGEPAVQLFSMRLVALQAVTTSIDALAVGVSFAGYTNLAVVPATALIGATTFCLCLAALELGRRLGLRFGAKAQAAGGIILVVIGIRAAL